MYIYVLDALMRRDTLIDKFISCIWTERFGEYGDFELIVESTPDMRRLFIPDAILACNRSYYLMRVKTTTDATDEDGRPTLKVTGFSLEQVFDERVAFGVTDDLTGDPVWTVVGPPATVAREMVTDICITGILSPYDKIPYLMQGSFLPDDMLPEPADSITLDLEPKSLGDTVKDICRTASLGFRILRQDDTSQLYFDIYTGSDRTTKQNLVPAVVFTPELDNLQDTTEFTSTENYRNVAYVYSPAGFRMVYAQNVDPESEGFSRHILVVVADDVTSDNPDIPGALEQRGQMELAKCQAVSAFDGTIDPNSSYIYNRDYFLGDITEVRGKSGATNDMRVTEQIFVEDGEGERAYPTLTLNVFINPGSWLSWKANQVWSELGPTEYWATQP